MVRIKRYGVIFLIALIAGIITGSLLKSSYFNELKSVMDIFEGNAANYPLYMGAEEKLVFLVNVFVKRGVPFLLLWILAGNRYMSVIYILWLCISNGYMLGFMCRFFAMAYKETALKIIVSFYFPHYIFYAAAYFMAIMYITLGLKKKKAVICGLVILVICGALLETYINPGLLCKVFT